MRRSWLLWIVLFVCEPAMAQQAPKTDGTLEFVESVPVETVLDVPEIPQAAEVFAGLLDQSRTSVEVASFYFSTRPVNIALGSVDAFHNVMDALVRGGKRHARVHALADKKFAGLYPEDTELMKQWPGVELRVLDAQTAWGGVQHAKYFVLDASSAYVGSHNWDWRSFTHIRELGAVVHSPLFAQSLSAIFAVDWRLAGQEPLVQSKTPLPSRFSLRVAGGTSAQITLAASPQKALPAGIPWDEPLLVKMIDSAKSTLHVQLLSHATKKYSGEGEYRVLDDALRRAAARGVQVHLLVANWSKSKSKVGVVQALATVPGIEVRFSNIPQWSGGFVEYARVEHAKLAIADGRAAWIGTANWGHDYFYESRNVSVFVEGDAACDLLERFFAKGWESPYVERVDPSATYEAPRQK